LDFQPSVLHFQEGFSSEKPMKYNIIVWKFPTIGAIFPEM